MTHSNHNLIVVLIAVVLILVLSSMVSAVSDFTPSNNINMRGRNITNASHICLGADCRNSWVSAGNASWNESLATTIYYPLASNPLGYLNSTAYQSSAAGWTNNSTTITTALQVQLNGSNAISFTNQNENISQRNVGNIDFSARGYYVFASDTNGNGVTTDDVFVVSTASVMRFVIEHSGRIGIGSSAPLDLLYLNGSTQKGLWINTDSASGLNHILLSGTSSGTNFSMTRRGSVAKLYLGVGNNGTVPTSAVVIDSSSNVGIGTDSPASKLNVLGVVQINDTTTGVLHITSNDGSLGGNATISFQGQRGRIHYNGTLARFVIDDGGSTKDVEIGTMSAEKFLYLKTGNAARMTINGTGYVGLGTSSPTAALDVRSLAVNEEALLVKAIAGQATNVFAVQDSGGNSVVYTGGNVIGQYFYGTSNSGDSAPAHIMQKAGNSTSSTAAVGNGANLGQYIFQGTVNPSFTYATGAIITANAAQQWNTTAAGTNLDFWTTKNNNLSGQLNMRLSEKGQLSVYGTTGDDALLTLDAQGAKAAFISLNTEIDSYGGIYFVNSSEDRTWILGAQSDHGGGGMNIRELNFINVPLNRSQMTLTSTGRIGIFNRNPTTTFEVNGTTNITNNLYLGNPSAGGNVYFADGAAKISYASSELGLYAGTQPKGLRFYANISAVPQLLINQTSGYVGIMTLNGRPTQQLDVNGSINVSGTGGTIYLPGGGYITGNSTAIIIQSP
jgi:hypothetical protein